jgi:hypothetical protein
MPPVEIQTVTVCILFNKMAVSVCTHIYISKSYGYDSAGKIVVYDELVVVIHAVIFLRRRNCYATNILLVKEILHLHGHAILQL